MVTVYLALGSNVGNSQVHIEKAIQLLASELSNVHQAPLYSSKAVGYTDQANFLNTAISGQTSLSAQELLRRIKEIEQEVGRVQRFHWGPREIDIDLILYGDLVENSAQLTLPHAYFRERDFVLRPLADLNSSLVDPSTAKTVRQLLKELPSSQASIIRQVT